MHGGKPFEELFKRAQLFDHIAKFIQPYLNEQQEPINMLRSGEAEEIPAADGGLKPPAKVIRLLPKVAIVGRQIICNHQSLDLASRPLTLKLFCTFYEEPNLQLSREQVLQRVYGVDPEQHSARYIEAREVSVIKLISRARALAKAHLSRSSNKDVQWFVYSQENKVWTLYQLKNEYLTERLIETEDQDGDLN